MELKKVLQINSCSCGGSHRPNPKTWNLRLRQSRCPRRLLFRCMAQPEPWSLMRRIYQEENLNLPSQMNIGMVLAAAMRESKLDAASFTSNLKTLMILLPPLDDHILRLKPQIIAELVDNPSNIAVKLVQLRQMLPTADVGHIVSKRPMLLRDDEFDGVPAAIDRLTELFPQADIGKMVEYQPLMLVEDLDKVMEQLRRLLPNQDIVALLQRSPNIICSVAENRSLSIW
eukprot:jgi/Botrbrau1/13920/Bobra.136_2s0011.2